VSTAGNGVTCGSHDPQDGTDHQKDDPDGPQDRDAGKETDYQKDYTKGDHHDLL
jgi:hypothetical protein